MALFVNRDYAVARTVVIERPSQEVFGYVKLLRNQDLYSKWADLDPNMEQSFSGTDGTVGFISAWKGNSDVGEGEQEIMDMDERIGADYDYGLQKLKGLLEY